MKVYAVFEVWRHEGETLESLHVTREGAENGRLEVEQRYRNSTPDGLTVEIKEWEVRA